MKSGRRKSSHNSSRRLCVLLRLLQTLLSILILSFGSQVSLAIAKDLLASWQTLSFPFHPIPFFLPQQTLKHGSLNRLAAYRVNGTRMGQPGASHADICIHLPFSTSSLQVILSHLGHLSNFCKAVFKFACSAELYSMRITLFSLLPSLMSTPKGKIFKL